jgi:tetratricopeptide (TPR) repeat protein
VIPLGWPAGLPETPLEASRKALAFDPNLAEAHKALGLAYLVRGRLEESVVANRRALELKSSYAPAVGNLGLALLHMGRLDEALSVEKRSVELDPTNSVSFEALGHAYCALRGPRQAALRRSIEMQPDLGTAHRAPDGSSGNT